MLRSFFTRVCSAAVVLAAIVASLTPLSSQAGTIVYGNLGASGTSPIGTTNTDLGTLDPTDINWLAQGFNTGTSSLLSVDAVTVGLFGSDSSPIPLTVSIYSSGTNGPGTALFTSSTTAVGSVDKYRFTFTGATLAANTDYFIVPNGGSWYWAAGASPLSPQQQNASGYSYTRTMESLALTTTPAGPWVDPAASNRYSVSLEAAAVPEPSTLMLACVGIAGGIAIEQNRRRTRRRAAATVSANEAPSISVG